MCYSEKKREINLVVARKVDVGKKKLLYLMGRPKNYLFLIKNYIYRF